MQNFNKIIISEKGKHIIIAYSEISYIQGHGSFCEIYGNNSKSIVSKNLKYIEKVLDKDIFIRIHQSYIINIYSIRNFCLNGKSSITTLDNITLSVSRNYKEKLRLMLKNKFNWI